jgi:hypothetical protein
MINCIFQNKYDTVLALNIIIILLGTWLTFIDKIYMPIPMFASLICVYYGWFVNVKHVLINKE